MNRTIERKIHYKGKPFQAELSVLEHQLTTCTPIVFEEKERCGIALIYQGGEQSWGFSTTRNIIAAWRGTEMLKLYDVIEPDSLEQVYIASLRGLNTFTTVTLVSLMATVVIEKIGQDNFARIMTAKVPEEIIQAILDNQGDGPSPDITSIAQEIRAGTIKPRVEFANLCLNAVPVSIR